MAIQENGTSSLDYFAMLKGWEMCRAEVWLKSTFWIWNWEIGDKTSHLPPIFMISDSFFRFLLVFISLIFIHWCYQFKHQMTQKRHLCINNSERSKF
jgi:hypothetical protein